MSRAPAEGSEPMRAIVIHAAHDLRIEERAEEVPGPGQLRLRLATGGICGSDLHYYNHGGFGTVREGVTCLSANARAIIAGGAEGTVAVWARRWAAGGDEAPPDLIVREPRAHSIVRCVLAPAKHCDVLGVLSGGGEGAVRLWHTPTPAAAAIAGTRVGSGGAAAASQHKVMRRHTERITGLHMDNFRIVTGRCESRLLPCRLLAATHTHARMCPPPHCAVWTAASRCGICRRATSALRCSCLLYTSDAADE